MKVIYVKNDEIYVNEDDRVVKKEFGYEKGIVTSTLNYKNILNMTFKLSKNIDKDLLESEAEKYIFTEGSLSYDKEYKIDFVFKEYEEHINVEAFVVEVDNLQNEFAQILKTYKYIDFISAKPFVFQAFYDITGLTPGNDIFVYLDDEEAFLSCFSGGDFIFVKSLSDLSALFKQLEMKKEDVIEILKNRGLEGEKYEDLSQSMAVDSFFTQFFMKISNLINYAGSYYSITKVDKIYFYTPYEINGLMEKYVEFWKMSGIEFKKYELETDYDYFDYSAVIYNTKNYENESLNFTIFSRPKPFYQTHIGRLVMAFAAALSLVAADAGYKYYMISKYEQEMLKLKKLNAKHIREVKLIKNTIKKYQAKLKNLKEQNSNIQKQISDISDKIFYLSQLQKKIPVANEFADLTKELKKYNLKIISFQKEDSHITIEILSGFNNSSDIAKFMKDMYKLGYKNITSTQITNENSAYISEVSYDE